MQTLQQREHLGRQHARHQPVGPLLELLLEGDEGDAQKVRKLYSHISRYRDALRKLRPAREPGAR